MSVHCSTLRLRDGLGWERQVLDVITIFVLSLPSFCLQLTPPVIAKMFGKEIFIQEIYIIMASSFCGVLL
jgi:hypothetical protein